MDHNEESIDLSKLLRIMVEKKKTVAGIVGICTLVAVVIAFILPKQYESTTLVQTRSAGKDIGGAAAMAAAMGISTGGSSAGSPLNYIELMKSRTVLDPIIDNMEWKDEKAKPEAGAFAKSVLKIENTKQTNLITVTAKGKTPEEAQMISQSVVDNFLMMQTDKNQQTQSLLVKFLNQRIEDAKKDADEASQKFADYQKEHKVYSPEEQAKATVAKMNAFDNAIGDMEVQQKASQAELDTANAKLGEMKAASRSYQINDNANVQGIRNQIVAKQLQLVDLNQKYTEEHPSVIAAKKELTQLQRSLANEVNAVVASNATSMNPTQASLMQKQAQAQASIAVARASEAAIRTRRDEKKTELGDFPNEVLEYMNLQREATIKNEIYVNLVRQCEQDKIQEAMESMDIQIIDPANLPDEDRPAAPKKKLIAAIGFVVGCLLSFGYGIVLYKKEA